MLCVECGSPVPDVYKEYGGAGNIRLSHCDHCHKIADKYVEFEFVIIFIDLLLLRLPVYRHLLFNRIPHHEWGIDLNCLKIFLIYIAFDAYLKYLVISETGGFNGGIYWVSMGKATIPILPLATYCYILLTALAEYSIFIFSVLIGTYFLAKKNYTNVRYNYVVMALIISSFAKPLYMLLMLWGHQKMFALVLDIFVLTSNVAAMRALLGDNNQSFLAVGIGHGVRTLLKGTGTLPPAPPICFCQQQLTTDYFN